MIEQVLDCHCHYHGHDRRGSWSRSPYPEILEGVSPRLSAIKIASGNHNFIDLLTMYATRIFYLQGINKGVGPGGQVSADAHQPITNLLQRVKSHILRPIWWGTNVSNFTHTLILGCRNMVQGFVALCFGALNSIKSFLNTAIDSDYFKISSKHVDSQDYNDTAFDFALEMNALEPLRAQQVKDKNCRLDVVKELEEFVAQRPPRTRFFGETRESPELVSEARGLGLGG